MTDLVENRVEEISDVTSRLLELPPELRNRLYELAFTTDDHGVSIPLFGTAGPSKALLTTCRQVYSEAHSTHKQAFRKHWKNSSFVCDLRSGKATVEKLYALSSMNVDEITDLCVLYHGVMNDTTVRWRLVEGRVWLFEIYENILRAHPRRWHQLRSFARPHSSMVQCLVAQNWAENAPDDYEVTVQAGKIGKDEQISMLEQLSWILEAYCV